MKALILNSGLGSRMGDATKTAPKCMSEIKENTTILSNQIEILYQCGIKDIVITTGAHSEVLKSYVKEKYPEHTIEYVHNDKYAETNYIYSIYLAKEYLCDDILMMHGDLVFGKDVLNGVLNNVESCVVVDKTLPLPQKDFKAVISNNVVKKIGIDFFDNAYACQPLYKLNKNDWTVWLNEIENFCNTGNNKVYAENAFNEVSEKVMLVPYDVNGQLCREIDTIEDLTFIRNILA